MKAKLLLIDDSQTQSGQIKTVLERLGWSFLRVRASELYRNPDLTMRGIFAALEKHDIRPRHDHGTTQPPVEKSDLAARVLARAEELKKTRFGGLILQTSSDQGDQPFRRFKKRRKRTEATAERAD